MTISSTIRRLLLGAAVLAASAAVSTVPSPAATRPSKPTFSTNGATHIVGTSAQLQGTDTPNGQATSYYFEYGPTTTYGHSSKPVAVATPATLTGVVRVGQTVTGLAVGWHYRIVGLWTNPATGLQEKIPGKDKQFKGRKIKARLEVGKGKESLISTVYGGNAEVAGTLTGTGNASQPLSLQATPYPFTAAFTTLPGTVLTGRTGSFVFKVARVTRNTEVRVQTLAARPLFSPTIIIHVTPKITLHVRSAGNTGLYRLYGTVSPARNGAPVQIQQLLPQKPSSKREGPRPHRVASTVLKRKTSSTSRFSVIVKLSGTFHYRAFVRLAKGAIESGSGSNVLIKAPRSSQTHHR